MLDGLGLRAARDGHLLAALVLVRDCGGARDDTNSFFKICLDGKPAGGDKELLKGGPDLDRNVMRMVFLIVF